MTQTKSVSHRVSATFVWIWELVVIPTLLLILMNFHSDTQPSCPRIISPKKQILIHWSNYHQTKKELEIHQINKILIGYVSFQLLPNIKDSRLTSQKQQKTTSSKRIRFSASSASASQNRMPNMVVNKTKRQTQKMTMFLCPTGSMSAIIAYIDFFLVKCGQLFQSHASHECWFMLILFTFAWSFRLMLAGETHW